MHEEPVAERAQATVHAHERLGGGALKEGPRRVVIEPIDVVLLPRDAVRESADARVALHRLTPSGADLLAAVSRPMQLRYRQISKRLGARSVAQLVTLCEQVIEMVPTFREGQS